MFLLTIKGKDAEGAYAIQNIYGEKVLMMFQQEDDAERYAMQIQEEEDKYMDVIEFDDNIAIMTCKRYNYKYAVVTANDLVIPPKIE